FITYTPATHKSYTLSLHDALPICGTHLGSYTKRFTPDVSTQTHNNKTTVTINCMINLNLMVTTSFLFLIKSTITFSALINIKKYNTYLYEEDTKTFSNCNMLLNRSCNK